MAQRVGRGIALLFHDRGTRRGCVVSSTPRPHFTPGKDLVPILQEDVWASGPVWTGGKSRPHRDSIPDRPARSRSLNRLSYRANKNKCNLLYIKNRSVPRCKRFPPRLLKTKRHLFYIRNQSVPRCKHFPPRLLKTKRHMFYIRNQSVPRCKHFSPRLLKTKRHLFYIRNQSVPRCKHFSPRLLKTKHNLFI